MAMELKAKLRLSVAVTLAVLSIIVVLQNIEPVETKILFMTVTMSRAALLGTTLLIGFVIGALSAFYFRRSN